MSGDPEDPQEASGPFRLGALRREAQRALDARPSEEPAEGSVTRAVFDVTVGDQLEVVTIAVDEAGHLKIATTAAAPERYVQLALETLAGDSFSAAAADGRVRSSAAVVDAVTGPDLRRLSAPTPDPLGGPDADGDAGSDLAEALREVLVAVARAGIDEARRAPAVQEALTEVVRAAGDPAPLGLARWVGMLKNALGAQDIDRCAWLLDGASRFAEVLSHGHSDPVSKRRRVAWLGAANATERSRISDRTLAEIGREVLSGLERRSLERRYLICLNSGEVFREERIRGAGPQLSVGPAPRLLAVGLAEVEDGIPPKRIRLLQYSVSSELSKDQWVSLGDVATRRFDGLAESYRETRLRFSGVYEPFTLLAPADLTSDEAGLALLDAEALPLPIARSADPSVAEALVSFLGEERPLWVAGRLIDAEGTMMCVPTTVARGEPERPDVLRLA